MSIHRYTSWGRTRQPKNLAGAHLTKISASYAVPTQSSEGYNTENQRYLHLLLSTTGSGANATVTCYGYYHAFGKWVALEDTSGAAITIAANNTTTHQIHEIAGVDKVQFVSNVTLQEYDSLFAAGSTFQGS